MEAVNKVISQIKSKRMKHLRQYRNCDPDRSAGRYSGADPCNCPRNVLNRMPGNLQNHLSVIQISMSWEQLATFTSGYMIIDLE